MKMMQKKDCMQGTLLKARCLALFLLSSILLFGLSGCGSNDDDDSHASILKTKICGKWVVRCVKYTVLKDGSSSDGTGLVAPARRSPQKWDNGTELTFHEDGTYDDSSSGGRHKWDANDGDNTITLDGDDGYHYVDEGGNNGEIEYNDGEYVYIWCWQKDPGYNPGGGGNDDGDGNRVERCVECEFPDGIDPSPHMPIYPGPTPPVVENLDAYLLKPMIVVYCSDAFWPVGEYMDEEDYIRFSNQNVKTNTLDYENKAYESSTGKFYSTETGNGVYISGTGNNFTVFFKSWGSISGTTVKVQTLTVMSGTKTSSGIRNLHYMTMFVNKTGDAGNNYMKVGTYRIFKDKDANSPLVSWPTRSNDASTDDGTNVLPWRRYVAK